MIVLIVLFTINVFKNSIIYGNNNILNLFYGALIAERLHLINICILLYILLTLLLCSLLPTYGMFHHLIPFVLFCYVYCFYCFLYDLSFHRHTNYNLRYVLQDSFCYNLFIFICFHQFYITIGEPYILCYLFYIISINIDAFYHSFLFFANKYKHLSTYYNNSHAFLSCTRNSSTFLPIKMLQYCP